MTKQYRILQKIYKEGTKYQETIYYPQVMDSHTLNDKIEPWEFFTKDTDQPIHFLVLEIMEWSNDETKTAGELTRSILKLIK